MAKRAANQQESNRPAKKQQMDEKALARLKKLKISKKEYANWTKQLMDKGYRIEQADQVIIRRSPKKSVEALIHLSDELMALVNFDIQVISASVVLDKDSKSHCIFLFIDNDKIGYAVKSAQGEIKRASISYEALEGHYEGIQQIMANTAANQALGELQKTAIYSVTSQKGYTPFLFTREDLVKIAKQDGGSKNLHALKNHAQSLKNLGFVAKQIVKMVGHDGGSKNLESVTANHKALTSLGFNAEQIVKMVGHDGGSKNLESVTTNYEALKNLGFNAEQIVKMVGHDGGSKNLGSVTTNYEALKALGFDAEQIVKMVGHIGGSKNLESVTTNYEALKNLGFDAEQIVKMVGHIGGSKNLASVTVNHAALKALGFDAEQIVKMVGHGGGSKNLESVTSNHEALKALGFDSEQIVKMVGHIGGSKNLESVTTNYEALKALGFKAQQIVTMAGHDGGSKNLESVTSNHKALKTLGFGAQQIVKMVGHIGGSKNLEAVTSNHAALKALGFDAQQIIKMVGHNGGSKNLESVTANYEALQSLGFEAKQIVKMVGHDGGSKNLLAVTSNCDLLQTLKLSSPQIVSLLCHASASGYFDFFIKKARGLLNDPSINKEQLAQDFNELYRQSLIQVRARYKNYYRCIDYYHHPEKEDTAVVFFEEGVMGARVKRLVILQIKKAYDESRTEEADDLMYQDVGSCLMIANFDDLSSWLDLDHCPKQLSDKQKKVLCDSTPLNLESEPSGLSNALISSEGYTDFSDFLSEEDLMNLMGSLGQSSTPRHPEASSMDFSSLLRQSFFSAPSASSSEHHDSMSSLSKYSSNSSGQEEILGILEC